MAQVQLMDCPQDVTVPHAPAGQLGVQLDDEEDGVYGILGPGSPYM